MQKLVSILGIFLLGIYGCQHQSVTSPLETYDQETHAKEMDSYIYSHIDIKKSEANRILTKANYYLLEQPITITATRAARSAGGLHDFYSEGDYWWPDPTNPTGPYIRRDGETNPENFVAHRKAMIRFSEIVSTLTSAYLLTNDEKYASHAVKHLNAWFVDAETKMNSNLLYGQAIKGLYTGRSIGIIDTLHLVEVALSVKKLHASDSFPSNDQAKVTAWFRSYLNWINTHEYGLEEKIHPNNHGVSWSLQAAAFSQLTGDRKTLEWIRHQFKTVYVPEMMNAEGGFTEELNRTKAYGYSLFMVDIMAGVAQLASTKNDDLWQFELADGRGMKRAMEFIYPFINDKKTWPKAPDVQYWEDWPVRQPSLLMAGIHFNKPEYIELWKTLEADPTVFEVLRNLPLRHPLLWISTE